MSSRNHAVECEVPTNFRCHPVGSMESWKVVPAIFSLGPSLVPQSPFARDPKMQSGAHRSRMSPGSSRRRRRLADFGCLSGCRKNKLRDGRTEDSRDSQSEWHSMLGGSPNCMSCCMKASSSSGGIFSVLESFQALAQFTSCFRKIPTLSSNRMAPLSQ